MLADTSLDDIGELLFLYEEAYLKVELLLGIASVHISEILRYVFVENKASYGRVYYL